MRKTASANLKRKSQSSKPQLKSQNFRGIYKKVLVTGGCGFIGSHLVDALLEEGYKVRVIDNLSNGKIENLNKKSEFFSVDIRELEEIRPLFRGIDAVFHCAALARVQPSIENPAKFNDHNVKGTLNVLMASRDNRVKKFIYSSSSSVYGDQKELPLREDMAPNPISPYALQKYIGELYCGLFSYLYGLPTVCLRYFNVYGPRQASEGAYALVIAKFLEQKRRRQQLTITGDGRQTRDFTHVRDVVRANILAMRSQRVGRGEAINIGAGENQSINKIALLVGGEVLYIKPRIEPRNTLADNTLARRLLGWRPIVKIEEGIGELLEIYGKR